jgi:hypothetical protein
MSEPALDLSYLPQLPSEVYENLSAALGAVIECLRRLEPWGASDSRERGAADSREPLPDDDLGALSAAVRGGWDALSQAGPAVLRTLGRWGMMGSGASVGYATQLLAAGEDDNKPGRVSWLRGFLCDVNVRHRLRGIRLALSDYRDALLRTPKGEPGRKPKYPDRIVKLVRELRTRGKSWKEVYEKCKKEFSNVKLANLDSFKQAMRRRMAK